MNSIKITFKVDGLETTVEGDKNKTLLDTALENDIKISASESTTTQLIDKIILLNNSKKINISNEIIESFKSVLNNADLVKFAKFSPEDEVASDDNKVLKSFIVNTKKSIPNNLEQENIEKKLNGLDSILSSVL